MVQWYNLTSVDASNVLTLTRDVSNNFVNGILGNLMLIVIFFVSFMSFMYFNNNPKVNLMVSSSIIAVLSIPLLLLELIPDYTAYFCWALFAIFAGIMVATQ